MFFFFFFFFKQQNRGCKINRAGVDKALGLAPDYIADLFTSWPMCLNAARSNNRGLLVSPSAHGLFVHECLNIDLGTVTRLASCY